MSRLGQSSLITASYWAATICEGSARIIIPFYFLEIGFSVAKVTALFIFFEVFSFLTNYFSGVICNRVGYKKALIFSMIAHTIASVGYLLPTGIMTNMVVLASLRAFRGIGKELSKTASSAYTKVLEPKGGAAKKDNIFIHILLGGKDAVKGLGLLIGTSMYLTLGFEISFLVLGALTGTVTLLSMAFLKDYREPKKVSLAGFFNVSPTMYILSTIRGFLYMGREMWWAVALPAYFLNELGGEKSALGMVLSLGLIVFGISQSVTGVLIKKEIKVGNFVLKKPWKYQFTMPRFSFLLMLVPVCMILLKEDPTWLLVFVLFYNLFAGLATAPHNFLHVSLARPDRTGPDIAFYKTFSSLGEVLALLVSGALYETYGITSCLYFSALVLMAGGVLSMWLPDSESSKDLRGK